MELGFIEGEFRFAKLKLLILVASHGGNFRQIFSRRPPTIFFKTAREGGLEDEGEGGGVVVF